MSQQTDSFNLAAIAIGLALVWVSCEVRSRRMQQVQRENMDLVSSYVTSPGVYTDASSFMTERHDAPVLVDEDGETSALFDADHRRITPAVAIVGRHVYIHGKQYDADFLGEGGLSKFAHRLRSGALTDTDVSKVVGEDLLKRFENTSLRGDRGGDANAYPLRAADLRTGAARSLR